MRLAAVVPFQDEERLLGGLLGSLERQSRPADRIVLVDDGSRDGSGALAAEFCARHPEAGLLALAPRPPARDRLAGAGELRAFAAALEGPLAGDPWDILLKLDADVVLDDGCLAALAEAFRSAPRLGIAGPALYEDGALLRGRPEHVPGAAKAYRRAAWDQIAPLPAILGWDTIDELRARRAGFQTRMLSDARAEHVRPMGAHDGRLRAQLRWGACAWGYGEHPLHVVLMAARHARSRPWLISGAAYAGGWALAGVRRAPRAEAEVRAFGRADQMARIRARLRRGGGP